MSKLFYKIEKLSIWAFYSELNLLKCGNLKMLLYHTFDPLGNSCRKKKFRNSRQNKYALKLTLTISNSTMLFKGNCSPSWILVRIMWGAFKIPTDQTTPQKSSLAFLYIRARHQSQVILICVKKWEQVHYSVFVMSRQARADKNICCKLIQKEKP